LRPGYRSAWRAWMRVLACSPVCLLGLTPFAAHQRNEHVFERDRLGVDARHLDARGLQRVAEGVRVAAPLQGHVETGAKKRGVENTGRRACRLQGLQQRRRLDAIEVAREARF